VRPPDREAERAGDQRAGLVVVLVDLERAERAHEIAEADGRPTVHATACGGGDSSACFHIARSVTQRQSALPCASPKSTQARTASMSSDVPGTRRRSSSAWRASWS